MRYLFVSNYYPPYGLGGYEQWCQEVADELVARGHQVQILTAAPAKVSRQTGGNDGVLDHTLIPSHDGRGPVLHRRLHLELDGGLWQTIVRLSTERKQLEDENLQTISQVIDDFRPDAAMIWGMWNMPRSVPSAVESMLPGRVAYYICDYWLSLPSAYVQRWQEDSRRSVMQTLKQILGIPFLHQLQNELPVGLALEHPICVSKAVREILMDEGVPVGHAQVIHGGTQVETFASTSICNVDERSAATQSHSPSIGDEDAAQALRLVFGGRLLADKGVHTVLQALVHVRATAPLPVKLDIYGTGDEGYVAYLHTLVGKHGLGELVTFCGSVPRTEMPTVLAQYDAFVFASEWQEPFARSVLEAMAAGLAVVGTTTGGTGEILVENVTGLTYPAGNVEALAAQLTRLAADRTLLERLAGEARKTVLEHFTFDRMVNDLEEVLTTVSSYATERNLVHVPSPPAETPVESMCIPQPI